MSKTNILWTSHPTFILFSINLKYISALAFMTTTSLKTTSSSLGSYLKQMQVYLMSKLETIWYSTSWKWVKTVKVMSSHYYQYLLVLTFPLTKWSKIYVFPLSMSPRSRNRPGDKMYNNFLSVLLGINFC